eukprot:782111-Rhodomonas_salina.1
MISFRSSGPSIAGPPDGITSLRSTSLYTTFRDKSMNKQNRKCILSGSVSGGRVTHDRKADMSISSEPDILKNLLAEALLPAATGARACACCRDDLQPSCKWRGSHRVSAGHRKRMHRKVEIWYRASG